MLLASARGAKEASEFMNALNIVANWDVGSQVAIAQEIIAKK
jgi:hypothetical protein